MPPEVIFCDNHILVVDKPAGMLTQPNGTEQQSLEEWAKAWVKERYNKPGAVFLHALHRIDKPVKGLVLFARTSKALSRLNAFLRQGKMKKTYLAQVDGKVGTPQATLEHYLVHDDHCAIVGQKGDANAKLARLHYRLVEGNFETSYLQIELETGRYHQIRAQMAQIGHPIVGDQKYGSKQKFALNAIALQHYRFEFPHPITHENLTFESQSPIFHSDITKGFARMVL